MVAINSDNNQIYKIAIEKIENNNFTVIMNEVFTKEYSCNIDVLNITDSYIKVSGNKTILRIDPVIDAFSGDSYIIDTNSSMRKEKNTNDKDQVYIIKLKRDKTGDDLELRITLYKNSNIVYVQIKTLKYKREIIGLKGYIYI
ncbi:MAG: hypothetical protein ACRCTQ_02850 [Brevinemataceae bacterium]